MSKGLFKTRTVALTGLSLTIAGKALPTLAIMAYFSGWQYVNEYFSSFGINRSSFAFNDYTIFTYSFSVLANIPSSIIEYKLYSLTWILPMIGLFLGPVLLKASPLRQGRLLLLRTWSWMCLLAALFFCSQQAGRLDASRVMEGNARPVDIIFSTSFKDNLIATKGKAWADQKIEEIEKASNNNALALIWRSSNETVLLVFESSGSKHGTPIEILRIDNGEIVATLATPL